MPGYGQRVAAAVVRGFRRVGHSIMNFFRGFTRKGANIVVTGEKRAIESIPVERPAKRIRADVTYTAAPMRNAVEVDVSQTPTQTPLRIRATTPYFTPDTVRRGIMTPGSTPPTSVVSFGGKFAGVTPRRLAF